MTKKILTAIILTLLLILPSRVKAQKPYEHISSFEAAYKINEDGTVDVLETIRYHFPDPKHGIFRKIPLVKENQDGDKFIVSVSDVSVKSDWDSSSGSVVDEKYKDNSTKRELNLKIGDPNKTITGDKRYSISYTLSGALSYFSDHDEFYWNLTGDEWDVPIEKARTTIILPNTVDSQKIKADCYTGPFGSTEQNCTITSIEENNFVNIFLDKSLQPGEGLTFAVSFPKGIVKVLEPAPDRSDLFTGIMVVLFGLVILGLYLVLPIILLVKNIKKRRKYRDLENRQVAAWFDPPKSPEGRFLTSGEVGILYDRKGDIRDITASIIQLAQKGYLKIVEKQEKGFLKDSIFEFVQLKDFSNDSKLQEHETMILEYLFKKGDSVTTKDISKRTNTSSELNKIYSKIEKDLYKAKLFEEDPSSIKTKWGLVTGLGTVFLNPLLIIAGLVGLKSNPRTEDGAKAYAVIKSLENFVKSQDKQIEYQAKNQMFFEKLLPYATALGVEDVWIKRFDDIDMQEPDWAESQTGAFVYTSALSSFNNTFTSSMSASSSRSSSGFSSGGGGGGFSGGGGGGGGGGSW